MDEQPRFNEMEGDNNRLGLGRLVANRLEERLGIHMDNVPQVFDLTLPGEAQALQQRLIAEKVEKIPRTSMYLPLLGIIIDRGEEYADLHEMMHAYIFEHSEKLRFSYTGGRELVDAVQGIVEGEVEPFWYRHKYVERALCGVAIQEGLAVFGSHETFARERQVVRNGDDRMYSFGTEDGRTLRRDPVGDYQKGIKRMELMAELFKLKLDKNRQQEIIGELHEAAKDDDGLVGRELFRVGIEFVYQYMRVCTNKGMSISEAIEQLVDYPPTTVEEMRDVGRFVARRMGEEVAGDEQQEKQSPKRGLGGVLRGLFGNK